MTNETETTVYDINVKKAFETPNGQELGTVTLCLTGGSLTMNGKELPRASLEYILNNAFKKTFADVYANSAKLTETEIQDKWNNRAEKLEAGTMGITVSKAKVSPLMQIAHAKAKIQIKANLSVDDWKVWMTKTPGEKIASYAIFLERNPDTLKAAEKALADLEKDTAIKVDMTGI